MKPKEFFDTKFQDTRYRFGFESKEGHPSICYGAGWKTPELHSIVIYEDSIIYEVSKSPFGRIKGKITEKKVPYKDDFYIPKHYSDFVKFVEEAV